VEGVIMSIRSVAVALVVVAALSAAGVAAALNAADGQRSTASQSTKVMKLTPEDYMEIQQLVVKYSHTLDGDRPGANPDPQAHADLFTDDATFRTQDGHIHKGRAGLVEHGSVQRWRSVGHVMMNHRIEPTAEGAVGQQYLFLLRPLSKDKDGRPLYAVIPYRYEDVYVKTSAGWRFKSRSVVLAEEKSLAGTSK
jgi:hypothetical protein